MDLEYILNEQINKTIPAYAISQIEKEAEKLSNGICREFSFEKIVNTALHGESFIKPEIICESIKAIFFYEVKCAMILGIEILIICIITGMLTNLSSSIQHTDVTKISTMVCSFIIAGLTISSFQTAYAMCVDSVSAMVSTMEIIAPILIGILITTGNFASGTILSPVITGSITAIGTTLKEIVLPMMFAACILAILNSLTEKDYVNKLSKLIRNAATVVTGFATVLLSGIISVHSLITETTDGLLINTARYSLSTFIPIVGSFTSDTCELFIRCMSSIKSITGVFGILMLLMMIVVPFIKLFVVALVYKITAAAAESLSSKAIADGLNDVGSCLVAMASILFFSALLFIIFISTIVQISID